MTPYCPYSTTKKSKKIYTLLYFCIDNVKFNTWKKLIWYKKFVFNLSIYRSLIFVLLFINKNYNLNWNFKLER